MTQIWHRRRRDHRDAGRLALPVPAAVIDASGGEPEGLGPVQQQPDDALHLPVVLIYAGIALRVTRGRVHLADVERRSSHC